jgi:GTP-binding protein HflX
MAKETVSTQSPEERGFLVGVELRNSDGTLERLAHALPMQESLDELSQLARTAGIAVVGRESQRLNRFHAATMIGPGKLMEIKEQMAETAADVVVFDNELSPRHQREIEKTLGEDIKVLDRTGLILDIFAQHAHTHEGSLQVELAQYEYRLPRLTRQWAHLARQAGGGAARGGAGGVGLRGPGETQLEVDRREIGRRIAYLKAELEKVRAHRGRHRRQRKRSGIPLVAIVGYTNAGKSTLLNALTGADVLVEDQLFATLDPTTRSCTLPSNRVVLFTDTVGFIQKLPTQLIAAFRATLEEVSEADLLVHVVDITHPHAMTQIEAVNQTLQELDVAGFPQILALNKTDQLPQDTILEIETVVEYAVPISAMTGQGLDQLKMRVDTMLYESLVAVQVVLPHSSGGLLANFHERGSVTQVQHRTEGIYVKGYLPGRLISGYRDYLVTGNDEAKDQDTGQEPD